MGGPHGMRSFMRDRSVVDHRVAPGTGKRMLRFAVPYRRLISWFLALVVIDAVLGAVNPLIIRSIINTGILGRDRDLVAELSLLLAGLAVADAALSLVQRWISASLGEGIIFDLRSHVFGHIQKMPIAFFTRTQTGALVTRLNNDVLGAQQAFTDTLANVVSNLVTVVIVLTAMFFLSWQITLLSLVLLPVFIVPARLMGRKLSSITLEAYGLNAEMNTTMTERFNVSGAMLVKLFGRPEDETRAFERRAGRVRDIGVTSAMYGRIFFASLMLTAALATALVYGWGGVRAVEGALDVGTVVALTAYLARLYGPLTSLSHVQVDERVFEVLDLPPMIDEKPDARSVAPGPVQLSFDHVDFTYPGAKEVSLASLESVAVLDATEPVPVLFDVSFTAEPGHVVALVGPSGAGKSTISNLVPRLYDVRGGAVRLNGVDVRDLTLDSLRDTVGMVTQDAHLFHETIGENLRYARPDATDDELWAALAAAQIEPLVRSLPNGLDTMVGDRGYRLSGGEKQRVAIARLLLKAPSVVVLDEATAHLDSESEAALQQALDVALEGRTSVVIAHRLSTIRRADQILVIDAGHIVERGTHDELLAAGGLYAELYHTQFADQAS
jgi:ATP-binding cassette subfamily B protein